jgi:hypothetical protein
LSKFSVGDWVMIPTYVYPSNCKTRRALYDNWRDEPTEEMKAHSVRAKVAEIDVDMGGGAPCIQLYVPIGYVCEGDTWSVNPLHCILVSDFVEPPKSISHSGACCRKCGDYAQYANPEDDGKFLCYACKDDPYRGTSFTSPDDDMYWG